MTNKVSISSPEQIVKILKSSVQRWHATPSFSLRNSMDETQSHQWRCAMLLLWLNPNCDFDTLLWALVHDVPETYSGDVPHPVKKDYPELRDLLKKIEGDFMHTLGLPHLDEDPVISAWVKLVDYLDALLVILNHDPAYVSMQKELKILSGLVDNIVDSEKQYNSRSISQKELRDKVFSIFDYVGK